MKPILARLLVAAALATPLCTAVSDRQAQGRGTATLFQNVRIFDGKSSDAV